MILERPILIVDDDPDYSSLLQLALQEVQVKNPIEILADGLAAVNYLKENESSNTAEIVRTPALMLLDLRMPGLGGLEVLRWIKTQDRLREVPVVVFTGTEQNCESSQANELGAAALHVKPFSYRELVQKIASICDDYLSAREVRRAA